MAHKSPEEFNSLYEVFEYFKDEKTCYEYLTEQRWNNKPICPHCESEKVYVYKDGVKFKCAECKKQFTAKAGLIFEDSKISLRKWFAALYLVISHRKGISSYQLARDLNITQKTAWFLSHRIRNALKQQTFERKLEGVVEIDETFVGGKNKNRHKDKKVKNSQGRAFKDKTPVIGMVERKGELRAFTVNNTRQETIQPIVEEQVRYGSTVYTDEWWAYRNLSAFYNHSIVNHAIGQYANGDTNTNTIEGFWGLLKRQIIGTHHRVSPKHLQKYVDESVFRYNTKSYTDAYRALSILAKNEGSIKYKQLIYAKETK